MSASCSRTHWSQLQVVDGSTGELKRVRQYFYERFHPVVQLAWLWEFCTRNQNVQSGLESANQGWRIKMIRILIDRKFLDICRILTRVL